MTSDRPKTAVKGEMRFEKVGCAYNSHFEVSCVRLRDGIISPEVPFDLSAGG
tara:strand:+ start:5824 stop:5979 length:156 start_codon:yes stop_codon:yes gene_type:complete